MNGLLALLLGWRPAAYIKRSIADVRGILEIAHHCGRFRPVYRCDAEIDVTNRRLSADKAALAKNRAQDEFCRPNKQRGTEFLAYIAL